MMVSGTTKQRAVQQFRGDMLWAYRFFIKSVRNTAYYIFVNG